MRGKRIRGIIRGGRRGGCRGGRGSHGGCISLWTGMRGMGGLVGGTKVGAEGN